MKVLVTTFPFAENNSQPLAILKEAGVELIINPLGRKMTTDEVANMSLDVDVIIAGTENLDHTVLSRAKKLKLISRVGIGLDGINLDDARKRGIQVTYTPDAPAPAVAELTMGLMLSGLRGIHVANSLMHEGKWKRIFGKRIGDLNIGVIGLGRIGSRVVNHLSGFSPRIFVNDINSDLYSAYPKTVRSSSKEEIYEQCDVITIHLPLNANTKNLISAREMALMRKKPYLINTSRGGIINENDLVSALKTKALSGAAIDVFEQEPYNGPLAQLDNCLMTCHMGSMSHDCRAQMEIEASTEVARFAKGLSLISPVPEDEYINQRKA